MRLFRRRCAAAKTGSPSCERSACAFVRTGSCIGHQNGPTNQNRPGCDDLEGAAEGGVDHCVLTLGKVAKCAVTRAQACFCSLLPCRWC
eukprot:5654930-Amphidinium_carterae.3